MDADHKIEHDWLFEKLLGKLDSLRNIILMAEQGWGIQDYASELGFHLAENNVDFQTCYMDLGPVSSTRSFLELYAAALSQRFPEVVARIRIDRSSLDTLKLPSMIARRKKIKVALFLGNAQLLHRIKDSTEFAKTLKKRLIRQTDCVFCLYGNNTPDFRNLVHYPGPLSGLGQRYILKHNPLNCRSASIRKLFHDHQKKIGYTTSVHISYMVDNYPFYVKLLAWHALIRTQHTCTFETVEKALSDLLHHFDFSFYRITESLTPKQIRFLKALTDENEKLYSQAIRDKYQLGSSSNVVRIKLSLERKEIIHSGRRGVTFVDPIFREWLRVRYFDQLRDTILLDPAPERHNVPESS